jgi:hypothetical protein
MKGSASRDRSMPPSFSQHLAGVGADDGDLRVLLGQVGDMDLPVPPFALQPVLHPGVDAVRAAGGGVAQEGVSSDSRATTPSSIRKPFSLHISP